jgi:DNA (cytosine-5)-methyltransferase 1
MKQQNHQQGMSERYRVIDLFAGAGGLSKGFEFYNQLEKSIFDIVAGLDSDERAVKTFYRNHETTTDEFSSPVNLQELTGREILNCLDIENIDVVLGGPPCQGFSHAGDRNPNDERNELIYKYHELVDEIQPEFFVMENVPGLKNRQKPEEAPFIQQLQSRFNKSGYEIEVFKLNAIHYGVPQQRKRLFIIGNNKGLTPQKPKRTHGIQKDLTMSQDSVVTVKDAILDLPSPIREEPQDYDDIGRKQSQYAELMRDGADRLYNHTPADHKQKTIEKMKNQEPGEGLYDWNHSWIRLELEKPSPTVKSNNRAPSVHPTENRVTTPRECARLQSFPDTFVFEGTKTSQLEQIGNAVPPLLARSLAAMVADGLTKISAPQADT